MNVRVVRAFFLNGKVAEPGAVVEIADRSLLGGLRSSGKVENVDVPETTGPMTTETAAGVVPGKRARNKEPSND
jgi:hypothetical protein